MELEAASQAVYGMNASEEAVACLIKKFGELENQRSENDKCPQLSPETLLNLDRTELMLTSLKVMIHPAQNIVGNVSRGLLATERIPAGQVLGIYRGKLVAGTPKDDSNMSFVLHLILTQL